MLVTAGTVMKTDDKDFLLFLRMKLAIANIATSDIYNRPGNLLLCDLDAGAVKRLHGHETRVRIGQSYQSE